MLVNNIFEFEKSVQSVMYEKWISIYPDTFKVCNEEDSAKYYELNQCPYSLYMTFIKASVRPFNYKVMDYFKSRGIDVISERRRFIEDLSNLTRENFLEFLMNNFLIT